MPSSQPATRTDAEGVDRSAPTWRGWLVVFAVALFVFALTANRGAQWQDSGRHILRILTGDLQGSLGLAMVHPLHHWLGRIVVAIGFLEPCLAITLVSSLAGALAVANTFGCVSTLTGSRRAALFAAGSLGLAHTVWQMATLAETYTLAAALLSAECWCLALYSRRPGHRALWSVLFFNGLGVANHLLAGLTTPILIVVAWYSVRARQITVRQAVAGAGLWLLASLPYTGLVLVSMLRSGDVGATLHSALFGHAFADEVLNLSMSLRGLLIATGFVILNFPNLLLPLAAFGLFRAKRWGVSAMMRRVLFAGLLIHVIFAMRYDVVDQHMFFLPAYVFAVIFGGIGFAVVERNARNRPRLFVVAAIALAATPVLYALAPVIARRLDVLRSVERHKPYRDDYVYVFTPWSVVERSAEEMSRHAVELAGGTGLILVEDSMALFAVRYRALRADGPDVQIAHEVTEAQIESAARAGRPVVIVPKNRTAPQIELSGRLGQWKRAGDLFVLQAERTDS